MAEMPNYLAHCQWINNVSITIVPGRMDRSRPQVFSFIWIISSWVIIVSGFCSPKKKLSLWWILVNLWDDPPSIHHLLEIVLSRWRHQMETFSALLALCAGNSPVTGDSQRPLTRSFDVFFDLRLNKRLSKQSRRRWFETPSRSLLRHCNNDYLYSWALKHRLIFPILIS